MRKILSTAFFMAAIPGARAMVPLALTTNYATHGAVADHRQGGAGGFTLSRFDFTFALKTFRSDDYKATVEVELPLRTLQMSVGRSEDVGSEFGGYRVAWKQTLWDFVGWDLAYFKCASPRLKLFEENAGLETSVNAKTRAFLSPSFLVRAQAGPGVRLTQNFGPLYFAKVGVEAIWQSQVSGKWAIRAESGFHHRESSAGRLPANLFTVEPQISWEIVRDFWVSAQYTRTLARPVGFENAMGDASLPGLYGDAITVGLSTVSL